MVESRARRRPWLASAALLPLLWVGAAIAADATSPAATATTSVSEIVVTATRKEEALSKVPVSVSAFTAAKMEVLEMKTFADVARFTPGVSFDEDSHDISIRGISSTAGSGTTGVYIDDTPVQMRNLGLNANNTLPAVYDLQRVEVLRGPQGTLFGAGSEGGTVRYITTQPSLTTFSGTAHSELAYTQDGSPSYELGAAFGGPIINDTLAFRISAWARRDGGWIDRVNYQTLGVTDSDANRADTYVLRAALTWAPIKNLTITPGINYQDRDQHNYNNYWVSVSNPNAGMFLNGTPDRMPDADHFLLPTLKIEYDGPVQVISNTAYYNRRELVGGYSGTIYNLSYFQHYLDPNPSLSIFGYPSDPQGVPCTNNCQNLYPLLTATGPNLPGLPNYYSWNTITNAQQNLTQEVRVQSNNPSARFQWVTGVFYAHDTQRSTEEIHDPELPAITQYLWNESVLDAWGENLLPNGDDYINDTRAHDQQIALFADATFAITDQLKAEVGIRYAWTHFDFVNLNDGPQDLLDDGGVPAIVSGSKNERPFTPKATLTWQATPDDMIYATAAKGYRIGGATPPLPVQACGPGFPDSYNSDSVWSYEIGSKDRFFDRRLQISGSAYYINWTNIQQAFYVPSCGIQFTTNAGQAVSKGFDLQSQWQVMHNLEVELTLGYTDAKFSKTALDANGDVLDEAGDSLDVVPWTATLGAQYNFPLAGREGFIRGDYIFNSKRHTPIPNEDPRTAFYDSGLVPDPATNEVSAKAGLNLGAWDLSIFAENLLNAHPQLNLQHQDSETLLFEAETFRPRTIGVSANYKY